VRAYTQVGNELKGGGLTNVSQKLDDVHFFVKVIVVYEIKVFVV